MRRGEEGRGRLKKWTRGNKKEKEMLEKLRIADGLTEVRKVKMKR